MINMKKSIQHLVKYTIISACTVAFLTSCGMGHDYDLSMAAPAADAQPVDIFPEAIGDDEVIGNGLENGGMECKYGEEKSITAARLGSKEEAEAYFRENLLPAYKEQSSNFSGNVNGQFYAKAGGDWQMFGWVNGNFAFSIKAKNDEGLAEIVEAFDYIQKK